MNGLLVCTLLAIVPFCLASQDSYSYKKGKSCYQCAYSPGRTEYKEETYKAYETDDYGNKKPVYKTRQIPVFKNGGWSPCKGPFTDYQAKAFGIDEWDNCHDNCYARQDKNGNIFRGCYKGEYGVNPDRLGCNVQQGALWCFCKGENCNNQGVPSF